MTAQYRRVLYSTVRYGIMPCHVRAMAYETKRNKSKRHGTDKKHDERTPAKTPNGFAFAESHALPLAMADLQQA